MHPENIDTVNAQQQPKRSLLLIVNNGFEKTNV